jgi:Protein of unknown function (DUF3048) N-terminal domain/Protein of unknown function (DUF3048) C-terminal domain
VSSKVPSLIFGSPKRTAIIAAAVVVVIALVAGSIFYYTYVTSLRADLVLAKGSGEVRVTDPVTVQFSRQVDTSHVLINVKPATPLTVKRLKDRLVVMASGGRWTPNQTYTLQLGPVQDQTHTATIKDWRAKFLTQPHVGVATVKVDGQPVADGSLLAPGSKLDISFTSAMKPASVHLTLNGAALPATALTWNKDDSALSFSLPRNVLPYSPVKLGLSPNAVTAKGEPVTDPWGVGVGTEPVMPSNSSSGIGPGFKTVPPIMVVIENSPPARPQSGFQNADMVFEYISEYSITRMTAVYFNQPAGQMGPVRSCRMINQYLAYGFGGYTLCSGASVGTLGQIFTHNYSGFSINDFDTGSHFRRVGFKDAPHNLYTDAGDAGRMRSERVPNPSSPYLIDPAHADTDMGTPADAPQIPLHSVGYNYDPSSASYLRFDHGTPFTEAGGGQLHVKNVVIAHVNFHMAGWIEDENGGAGSVWYDMTGTGPAEIYSDGKLVQGTWHMGAAGQNFSDLNQPMYFTDPQGNVVRLNTGLTWIHVVGNGQTS